MCMHQRKEPIKVTWALKQLKEGRIKVLYNTTTYTSFYVPFGWVHLIQYVLCNPRCNVNKFNASFGFVFQLL